MKNHRTNPLPLRSRASGVTLIELMIALVLGLLVVLAASGIFVSNRQVFRATENLSRVQENARVAYELMAREVREAGGNPCSRNIPIVNVLNDPDEWAASWADGVRGYEGGQAFSQAAFGTAAGNRVAGTDAVELRSGAPGEVTIVDHKPPSAQFKINTTAHGLQDGDIVMACDFVQGSIFQITGASSSNVTIVHNSGTGTPGNCSKGLGWTLTPCITTGPNKVPNGTPYAYGPNSTIARLRTTAWYVGFNGRSNGSRSLYRTTGQGLTSSNEEVTEGVQDMQLQYLLPGATGYVDATSINATNWKQVSAVRIVLTMQGQERVGTDGSKITRQLAHVVTLRNRNS